MNKCENAVKVLTVVSVFGVLPVSADNHPAVKNLEGFHVGIDAVYSHADVKNDIVKLGGVASTGAKRGDSDFHSVSQKCVRLTPAVNVGYSFFHDNWYAGLMADVSFGRKGNRVHYANGADEHFKMGGISYEVKAKGGYYFQELNSVVYGIAGIKWRKVDYDFDFKLPGVSSVSKNGSSLKSPLFVVGVGVERPIYKKLSLSAEYEYAWRNSSGEASDTVGGSNGKTLRVSEGVKQRLREHSVRIGFKYHF